MVGDEDQSIYGFRAAYPEALTSFGSEYQNARILKMEENFRSGTEIVSRADKFINKNTLRYTKNMRAARQTVGEAREIPLVSKTAQYSYILKVAKSCTKDTAVLYRDNESALPFINILEKYGVPYRVKALDVSFFTSRVVQDITNIIKFAFDQCDTEAFMQIYYKINTHLSKAAATAACEYCLREGMNVLDSVWEVGKLGMGVLKSCRSMKSHFENIKAERADRAVSRIVNYMGYGEYLDRMGIKRSKAEILEALGVGEASAKSLISRVEELAEITREHRAPAECKFTLSTVHSAKGLEYDTVYLADVCDGIFPENIVLNPKSADKDTVKEYEEERRLFYVGATRAKDELFVFSYDGKKSFFCDDFFGKLEVKTEKNTLYTKPARKELGYHGFCEKTAVGAEIEHKAFGKGTVIGENGDIIEVRFEKSARKLSRRMLYDMYLLK